jgi:hypothetical protein
MKRFRRTLLERAGLALLALAFAHTTLGVAQAHFALLQPPSALAVEDGGKGAPPCAEGPDSNVVTQVQGGHPLPIDLMEFVAHPGHYRFALSVNSRSELPPDPDVVQDVNGLSVSAPIQNPARIPVLADGVFVHDGAPPPHWQTSLTLPNLNCDKCTLQIIEFMAEHGSNVGGGFFYHHCADLKIVADTSLPAADPAWPRAVTPSRAAFSHIAAGGGWTTVMTLVNTSTAPVPVTVAFHGDDGSALSLPAAITQQGVTQPTAAAASVSAVINPNATLLISIGTQVTGDPTAGTLAGWADVQSSGPLGGYAIFRQTPASGSPSEGTAPLQAQFPSTVTLPYDNTGGFVMGVAMANLSATSANITATVWDDSGNPLGTQSLTIGGSGHTAFVLPAQLTSTAGKRGIVRFQSTAAGGISGLGLRFSPFGTFTSVPAM